MGGIIKIIDVLRDGNFYGAGKYTEIAKGENELVTDLKSVKQKMRRVWRSRRT